MLLQRQYVNLIYLENKGLVEDWVQSLALNFCLKFLLFVWKNKNLYVRIRSSSHVHCRQLRALDDSN